MLRLVIGGDAPLGFPLGVTCTFEQIPGASLGIDELAVTVETVTSNGVAGDPGNVRVSVAEPPQCPALHF